MMNGIFRYSLKISGIVLLALFMFSSFLLFDTSQLLNIFKKLIHHPKWVLLMVVIYTLAFFLRGLAWKLYVSKLSYSVCMNGIFLSLFVNHIVPFKVGDIVRVNLARKYKDVTLDEALHSVAVLRVLDVFFLILFSLVGTFYFLGSVQFNLPFYLIGLSALFLILVFVFILIKKPSMIKKHFNLFKNIFTNSKGAWILLLVSTSWLCEAAVIYGAATYFLASVSWAQSIWVNSLTVGSSVIQVAPGGIGTYESVMTLGLYGISVPLGTAYHIAIVSHVFKFAYSYIVGFIVMCKLAFQMNVKELLRGEGS